MQGREDFHQDAERDPVSEYYSMSLLNCYKLWSPLAVFLRLPHRASRSSRTVDILPPGIAFSARNSYSPELLKSTAPISLTFSSHVTCLLTDAFGCPASISLANRTDSLSVPVSNFPRKK